VKLSTAVIGDLEDFVGEVFRMTLARENIQLAKFLSAGEPAEHRGSRWHCGIGTDGPEAFTDDEPAQIVSAISALCPNGRPRWAAPRSAW
jgi:hypothetical protein